MEKIDYAKLNDRVVEQAYEAVLGEMSKNNFKNLFKISLIVLKDITKR
jgi:hypothetical protein